MADNNFRSYRGRDAGAPRSQPDDPLAELARLIGQREPASDPGHDVRRGPATSREESAGDPDWTAQERDDDTRHRDERYAEEPTAQAYDAAYDDGYEPAPPVANALPSYRPGASSDYDDGEYEPQGDRQISAPSSRLNGGRAFAREYYASPDEPRLPETPQSPLAADRQLPAFLPQSRAERYQFDAQSQPGPDNQAYALEDYDEAEEAPAGRRRRGFMVLAVVLGLAVIGTAGAFAYRAMFGSSMLPSLPPIIKAEDGPNKIIPAKPKGSTDQADAANASSDEKLVSREEQPVHMPAPVNPAPRVVSTIPIFPDPNSGQAGVPTAAQPGPSVANGQGLAVPSSAAPAAPTLPPPPMVASTAPAQANSIWPPAPAAAPPAAASAAVTAAPAAASTAPRKIHTVVIHSDQSGAVPTDATSAPPAAVAAAPEPAPIRTASPRPAAQGAPRPMSVARADANAPLSILPDQSAAATAPAPRVRTALARPSEASPAAPRAAQAPMAGGGYAVQVTSQRTEAEAQAEFRALKAKFPSQLGSREPLIRRADLGAKGVYYRALVGPFASADQATTMCSSLKAAGGSCIVQRN